MFTTKLSLPGAAVFFPDKEARRKQLFHMMKAADVNNLYHFIVINKKHSQFALSSMNCV